MICGVCRNPRQWKCFNEARELSCGVAFELFPLPHSSLHRRYYHHTTMSFLSPRIQPRSFSQRQPTQDPRVTVGSAPHLRGYTPRKRLGAPTAAATLEYGRLRQTQGRSRQANGDANLGAVDGRYVEAFEHGAAIADESLSTLGAEASRVPGPRSTLEARRLGPLPRRSLSKRPEAQKGAAKC